MQNSDQKPIHFSELQNRFPTRTDDQIGDAIERRKMEIGAAASRDEIMDILTIELS